MVLGVFVVGAESEEKVTNQERGNLGIELKNGGRMELVELTNFYGAVVESANVMIR